MIDFNKGKRPEVIEKANNRMERYMLITMACMFAYGVLVPVDWQSRFGLFGALISGVSEFVPAIDKLAQISPMPETLCAFVGLSALVAPALGVTIAMGDAMGERLRFAMSGFGLWASIKGFFGVYFLGVPMSIGLLWFCYELPISIDMTGGHTWGGKLMVAMITDRYQLAFFGAILTAGLGSLFFSFLLLASTNLTSFYIFKKGIRWNRFRFPNSFLSSTHRPAH